MFQNMGNIVTLSSYTSLSASFIPLHMSLDLVVWQLEDEVDELNILVHSSTCIFVLVQAGDPTWDNDQVISKASKVHDQFGGLSLHDVSPQSLKSEEVCV